MYTSNRNSHNQHAGREQSSTVEETEQYEWDLKIPLSDNLLAIFLVSSNFYSQDTMDTVTFNYITYTDRRNGQKGQQQKAETKDKDEA